MTRSEEELRVGTTEPEAGRVRLRKYVVEDRRRRRRDHALNLPWPPPNSPAAAAPLTRA
jgi:hypothetical protein